MKKVHKILIMILAAILTFGIALAVCWDMAEIYLMPRTVVMNAAKTAYTHLQQRFDKNPLLLAASYLDEEGQQSADVKLYGSDLFLGDLQYDMQIQTQPGYIQGSGTVYTGKKNLDLSFYADKTFMAVSSQDLLQGSYYGITYDTFLEDIRSIPLLSWMIGESVLQKWNQDIRSIQKHMEQGYPIVKLQRVEEKALQGILMGLATVPADVEKIAIELQDQVLDCHRVSFEMDGEPVARLMQLLADGENIERASASMSFYIDDRSLAMMEACLDAGDIQYELRMELGRNSLYDPLDFFISGKNAGAAEQSVIRFSSVCREEKVEEQWYINRGVVKKAFSYEWDPASGDMLLKMGDAKTFSLNLTEAEAGLTVRSDNLSGIYYAITDKDDQSEKVYSGAVTVRKGSDLNIPQYKNLDQWSMEDFLVLLEGIGSLIGLRFS